MMKCDNCSALYGQDNGLNENKQSLGKKHGSHFPGGMEEMVLGVPEDSDDVDIFSFLKYNDETEAQMAGTGEDWKDSPIPSDTIRASQMEMPPLSSSPGTGNLEKVEHKQPSDTNQQSDSRDEVMVEAQQLQEPSAQVQKIVTEGSASGSSFGAARDTDSGRIASGTAALSSSRVLEADAPAVKNDGRAYIDGSTSSTLASKDGEKASDIGYESDDSSVDIVDADPDSDECADPDPDSDE